MIGIYKFHTLEEPLSDVEPMALAAAADTLYVHNYSYDYVHQNIKCCWAPRVPSSPTLGQANPSGVRASVINAHASETSLAGARMDSTLKCTCASNQQSKPDQQHKTGRAHRREHRVHIRTAGSTAHAQMTKAEAQDSYLTHTKQPSRRPSVERRLLHAND